MFVCLFLHHSKDKYSGLFKTSWGGGVTEWDILKGKSVSRHYSRNTMHETQNYPYFIIFWNEYSGLASGSLSSDEQGLWFQMRESNQNNKEPQTKPSELLALQDHLKFSSWFFIVLVSQASIACRWHHCSSPFCFFGTRNSPPTFSRKSKGISPRIALPKKY